MLTVNGVPLAELGPLVAHDFLEWAPLRFGCEPIVGVVAIELQVGVETLGEPAISLSDPLWHWVWVPRGVVGIVPCRLIWSTKAGQSSFAFELFLQPRLLDQEMWQALLDDLSGLARSLATRLTGSSFASALLLPIANQQMAALQEVVARLLYDADSLLTIVQTIAAQPAQVLRSELIRLPLDQLRSFNDLQISGDNVADLVDWPGIDRDSLQLPESVDTRSVVASYDVPEHRWVLGLLRLVQRRVRRVRAWLERERASGVQDVMLQIERIATRLRLATQLPFLVDLQPRFVQPRQSQRLVRDRRYRPLKAFWHAWRDSLWLTLYMGELRLPLYDLPRLYEYWCLVQVLNGLLDLPGAVIAQSVVVEDVDQERWSLDVLRSEVLLSKQLANEQIRLRYQPRYDHQPDQYGIYALDGYVRIPDIVIERHTLDGVKLLILDAKYRRAPDGRVPQAALDDAYAYQGSIGRAGASVVQQAVVVYPGGSGIEDFRAVASVAATPGSNQALYAWLRAWFA